MMILYSYLCTFCGNIENSFDFRGMKCICGKCKRNMILITGKMLYCD